MRFLPLRSEVILLEILDSKGLAERREIVHGCEQIVNSNQLDSILRMLIDEWYQCFHSLKLIFRFRAPKFP